jgi:tetratricopeptide (TPR) repeat protein
MSGPSHDSAAPAEPTGSLGEAISNAARLLATDPGLAAEQATEVLRVVPGEPLATLLLGRARRACGDAAGAIDTLRALCATHPRWALAHEELGHALGAARRGAEAALRRAVALKPELAEAWLALADHLHAVDDVHGADEAYARYLKASSKDPRLLQAASAMCAGRVGVAERILRPYLHERPTDVAAIRMLAEVAGRLGRYGQAERLLTRCLELAPGFVPARHNYALVLHRQNRLDEARAQVERLRRTDPANPAYQNLHAAILVRLGEYAEARSLYEDILRRYPGFARVWLSYGHVLKTAGDQAGGIDAYRESLRLLPTLGESWWSLANLKTVRFTAADLAAMAAQLENEKLGDEDRWHFHFALGKGLEDEGRWEESFRHYDAGNALRRRQLRYDPAEMTGHVRRCRALFTREFFAARAGWGTPEADPIFIVGLPRAGSTLLEQILASHSAVEGTMELPDIIGLAQELGGRKARSDRSRYPEILGELDASGCAELGRRYLAQTRIQRKTSRPVFIDKMPNNFAHIALIHLALPNAKIVDARRHPLACGFSVFKQHFARGQNFAYSLGDIGRYYRDYVHLMAHYDAALPGRVHRVIHERLVEEPEAEIRSLLQYCNLPFEDACLRFHENDRAVRTASSEQVRRPLNREGIDRWREFEPWLGPLREALGPALEEWTGLPRN